MPTKLELTLDSSKYQQQLDQVVATTRAAGERMKAGIGNREIAVTADTSQAEKTLSGLSGSAQKFKAGAASISAIGAAAGASVPAVGMLATVVNALLSPISLLGAAFTALVAVGSRVWDKLTVSASEYAARAKVVSEEADRELAKFKEQDAAAGSYITRLKELSSSETAGNAVKSETAQLLDTLQSRYGDLGAEIDASTGKIKNLTEVEARLNAERRKRAASKHLAAADAAMSEAKAAYMKTTGGGGYFGERSAGKRFDKAAQTLSPEQLLKIFESRAKNATTEEDIQNYNELAGKMRKVVEEREKAKNVMATGEESGLAAEQNAAKKAQAATAAKKARDDAARQFAERKSDDEFAQEKDIGKKKANRQARIDAEKKNEAGYQQELDSAKANLEKIQKSRGMPGYDAGAEADAAKAVADAERKIEESKAKQYGFQQQMQQLDKQRDEAAKKMADNASFELEYNRLIAAGEYDKAAALKLEHELKQQNLKLTEEEKKAILDQQKAQKALNLQVSLRDKAQDLKWQSMEKAGKGKEAAEERALRDAEQRKGAKLTDQEAASVRKLSELTWNMNNQQAPQFGDIAVKTNSLTARGGFQGGAAIPDSEKIAREACNYNKRQADNTDRIIRFLEEMRG